MGKGELTQGHYGLSFFEKVLSIVMRERSWERNRRGRRGASQLRSSIDWETLQHLSWAALFINNAQKSGP